MDKVRIKGDSDSLNLSRIGDALYDCAGAIGEASNALDRGGMYCALLNTTMVQRPTHVTLQINGDQMVKARVTRWFIFNHEFRVVVEWFTGTAAIAWRIEEDQEAQILPPGSLSL